jgi:hypothetical protein
MGMETQTMVERPSVFFLIKKPIIGKILAVKLEGLSWARNKVGCSFGFGLWTLDLTFGGLTLCPAKGSNSSI